MTNPYDSHDDLDELLRQVDDLLAEPAPPEPFDEEEEDDFDLSEFAPEGAEEDEPILYQNYSNRYGADVRNYSNGYGTGAPAAPQPQSYEPSIPAYNADFRREQRREERRTREDREIDQAYGRSEAPAPKIAKKRRGGCCGCGCGTMVVMLLVLAVVIAAGFSWLFQPPKSDASIGQRKKDTAAILLCGTDEDGTRTDTMMLLYLSGSEKKVGLLSLPRDTYTITAAGNAAKLNSAYGRNGTGEEGMEGLLDYVQDIIGYRPDGYILVDFTLVPQVVDRMGGVEVEVPNAFSVGELVLESGLQELNGQELLALLRHRSTYANADLGRIEVQRDVITACMEQWLTPAHLGDLFSSLELVENGSLSTLNFRNYLWMGKTILLSRNNITNDTLPGYATYIGDGSYYVLYEEDVAQMINDAYNPYEVAISVGDLNIAG